MYQIVFQDLWVMDSLAGVQGAWQPLPPPAMGNCYTTGYKWALAPRTSTTVSRVNQATKR